MNFQGKIVRTNVIERDRTHHLPLLLSAEGAGRVTREKLEELRRLTQQEIRFVTDSRFTSFGLSGCMLVGYYCDGREFELGCWEWADFAHQVLGIEVDIERRDLLPSLLHCLGRTPETVYH